MSALCVLLAVAVVACKKNEKEINVPDTFTGAEAKLQLSVTAPKLVTYSANELSS
ncbi:hypothetical protein [Pedobacter jamesrossensis]|uniref:Uncharacterized protein n=2 Tax=Pedobacter jamesrossensis TaxID=1908238 RepID=A0ABV8NSE9_9SPHI